MAAFTAKIVGMDRLKAKMKHVPSTMEIEMRDTMGDAAELVKKEALKLIHLPKSGRWYTRLGIRYQASAPGEAPARATGKLANLIETKKQNRKLKPATKLVALVDYARLLEYGTKRMAARPFFGPAFRACEKKINDMIRSRGSKAIRKNSTSGSRS